MRVLALVLLCGCGRLDFDPATDATTRVSFCAGHPEATFCSDFDDGLPVETAWSDFQGLHQASYALSSASRSAPSGLHVTSVPVDGTDYAAAFVVRDTGVQGAHAVGSFDVRIPVASTNGAGLGSVRFDTATNQHGVEFVYVAPPALSFIEEFLDPVGPGATQYWFYMFATPSFDDWHRLTLDMTAGASPRVVVQYDDTSILDTPLADTTTGVVHFSLGLMYVGGATDAWELDFDNAMIVAP